MKPDLIRFPRLSSSSIAAVAIFLLAAVLYIRTAAPTLGGAFDSEEFQHVAYELGIAHATGYPLYLLLGKLFITIVPIGNVAYRMNLLSALLTAGAAAFIYLNALALTRRQIASFAAAALFATNTAVWRQAGVASVGPLNLLLVAAIIYAMLEWHAGRAPLTLAAFLFGLGLAHHRTVLLLAPAIALLVLLVDPKQFLPRNLARNLFWLMLPLLFYLYFPIFGRNSPVYSNSVDGFMREVTGMEAGAFLRSSLPDVLDGIGDAVQYLSASFGVLGGILIAVGAISAWPGEDGGWGAAPRDERNIANKGGPPRETEGQYGESSRLFLGVATLSLSFTVWGTLYAGEPDRYHAMPFVFLIYWFALGAAVVERTVAGYLAKVRINLRMVRAVQILWAATLALFLLLPLGDRLRASDWSAFDRVYKQWDEIFTLPIPQGAVLVGNWGQLNAMRYMQNVENRRPDLLFVGTLYDPEPQTEAALGAFAEGRSIFLAPGIPLPTGTYHYALLGPLLEVRDRPQFRAPDVPIRAADVADSFAALVGWGLSTALEPYAPLTHIAPARTARIALYWHTGIASKDFTVRINLYDPAGLLVSRKDEPPVRGLIPASQWQPGEYVADVHNFLIPAGSPPGVYQMTMQTVDAATSQPARAELALGPVTIDRVTDLAREQIFVAQPADVNLSEQLALWGYGRLDGVHHPGEAIGLDLLWYAREDVGATISARLALLDSKGQSAVEWQRPLISYYPTSQWKKGELLKAYYDLPLPSELPQGDYKLTLDIGGKPEALGQVQVTR